MSARTSLHQSSISVPTKPEEQLVQQSARSSGRVIDFPTTSPVLHEKLVARLFESDSKRRNTDHPIELDVFMILSKTLYKPDSFIATGSFSSVYKIHHTVTKQTFALKLLSSSNSVQSFTDEYDINTKLLETHPDLHIVTMRESIGHKEAQFPRLLKDSSEEEDAAQSVSVPHPSHRQLGMIFDYHPTTLHNLIYLTSKEQSYIPINHILKIFHDLLKTMSVIERMYLHLDIKPENILLDPATSPQDGWDFIPRIGDFGSALPATDITLNPLKHQTLCFRSPRILWTAKNCDSFSLGCVLYELLASSHLFHTWPSTRETPGFDELRERLKRLYPSKKFSQQENDALDRSTFDYLDLIRHFRKVFTVMGHPSQEFINRLSPTLQYILFPFTDDGSTKSFVRDITYAPCYIEELLIERRDLSERQRGDTLDLLKQLLNYEHPITAEEASRHPVFATMQKAPAAAQAAAAAC